MRDEQQRQGASNVTVRNVITSMRLISDIDWADLFESVSLVDATLRAASAFARWISPRATSIAARSKSWRAARGWSEIEIARAALAAAAIAARRNRRRATTPSPSAIPAST